MDLETFLKNFYINDEKTLNEALDKLVNKNEEIQISEADEPADSTDNQENVQNTVETTEIEYNEESKDNKESDEENDKDEDDKSRGDDSDDVNDIKTDEPKNYFFKNIIFFTNDRKSTSNKTLKNLEDAIKGTDIKLLPFVAEEVSYKAKDNKIEFSFMKLRDDLEKIKSVNLKEIKEIQDAIKEILSIVKVPKVKG